MADYGSYSEKMAVMQGAHSLKWRAVLTVGGLTSLLLMVALSLDLYREYQDRSQSLQKRGEFLSTFLSETLVKPLSKGDASAIYETLVIASNNPDFLGAVVRDLEGNEIKLGSAPFSISEQLLFHRIILYQDDSVDSHSSAEPLGTLTLLFSTRNLNQFLRDQLISKGGLVIILVLLTLMVLYFGTLSVIRPLRRLVEVMQQFSRGEYRHEVYGLHRSDEVADMAIALEVLRQNLLERDEIKLAEQRAKAADQAKSEFLANMSHEIRTPMNAVIGFTHLALKDNPSLRQRDYLNKIRSSSRSLLDIINDILDLSKIEAGQLDIEFLPFDLNGLFDQIADVTVFKAAEKRVEVIFDLDPLLPTRLIGDPTRIRQILINLMSNAVKFTDQGEVVVRAWGHFSEGKSELHFAVKDSGIGLTEAQMGRLFQAFSQADNSTSRKYGGTGLGLSISKKLTEMMGGEIEVNSVAGEGAEFHFYVKAAPQETDSLSLSLSQPLAEYSILVVDDHPLALAQMERMLTHLGASVETCSGGADAIVRAGQRTAEENPYNLILIDWDMPQQNGVAVAEQLLQEGVAPVAGLIVMLTSYCRQQALQQCSATLQRSLGWLVKPVTPCNLLQSIESRLSPSSGNSSQSAAAVAHDLSGMRVLLVEDNVLNQQVACEILQHAHVEVDVANNGREAIEQLRENCDYDLVLMDLQMPEMDGFEATEEIRKTFSSDQLPIIAMTANVMATERARAESTGIDEFLYKPIDVEALYSLLAERYIADRSLIQRSPVTPSIHYQWPSSLPGLDVEEGVARTMGNQQRYLEILSSFANQLPSLMETFLRTVESDDLDGLQRSIHAVKGVASNLSAGGVTHILAQLEQHVGGQNKITANQLSRLKQEIEQLTDSIHQLEQLSSSNRMAQQSVELPFDQARQQLYELLQENSFDAVELFHQIQPILEEHLDTAELERLSLSIENLNFAEAREALE